MEITQDLFKNLPYSFDWIAVDCDGRACAFNNEPIEASGFYRFKDRDAAYRCIELGSGYLTKVKLIRRAYPKLAEVFIDRLMMSDVCPVDFLKKHGGNLEWAEAYKGTYKCATWWFINKSQNMRYLWIDKFDNIISGKTPPEGFLEVFP